jgi:hypothetical protein
VTTPLRLDNNLARAIASHPRPVLPASFPISDVLDDFGKVGRAIARPTKTTPASTVPSAIC